MTEKLDKAFCLQLCVDFDKQIPGTIEKRRFLKSNEMFRDNNGPTEKQYRQFCNYYREYKRQLALGHGKRKFMKRKPRSKEENPRETQYPQQEQKLVRKIRELQLNEERDLYFGMTIAEMQNYVSTKNSRFKASKKWIYRILKKHDLVKPRMLILAMSYPSRRSVKGRVHDASSLESIKRLAKTKVINEIDARDLVRIQATEKVSGCEIYTISRINPTDYHHRNDRHLKANFNDLHRFHEEISDKFKSSGIFVPFKFLALDYFWLPDSWVQQRAYNIVQNIMILKRKGILASDCIVFLPFAVQLFQQLAIQIEAGNIQDIFKITYVEKTDDDNFLWKGTQEIPEEVMFDYFGKDLDQEEIYCKIDESKIKQASGEDIEVEELLDLFRAIPNNVEKVRFIKLEGIGEKQASNIEFF